MLASRKRALPIDVAADDSGDGDGGDTTENEESATLNSLLPSKITPKSRPPPSSSLTPTATLTMLPPATSTEVLHDVIRAPAGRYYSSPRPEASLKCYRCKEMGHFQMNCTSGPRNGGACFVCGDTSHTAASCAADVCFTCDEPGHRSHTCPNREVLLDALVDFGRAPGYGRFLSMRLGPIAGTERLMPMSWLPQGGAETVANPRVGVQRNAAAFAHLIRAGQLPAVDVLGVHFCGICAGETVTNLGAHTCPGISEMSLVTCSACGKSGHALCTARAPVPATVLMHAAQLPEGVILGQDIDIDEHEDVLASRTAPPEDQRGACSNCASTRHNSWHCTKTRPGLEIGTTVVGFLGPEPPPRQYYADTRGIDDRLKLAAHLPTTAVDNIQQNTHQQVVNIQAAPSSSASVPTSIHDVQAQHTAQAASFSAPARLGGGDVGVSSSSIFSAAHQSGLSDSSSDKDNSKEGGEKEEGGEEGEGEEEEGEEEGDDNNDLEFSGSEHGSVAGRRIEGNVDGSGGSSEDGNEDDASEDDNDTVEVLDTTPTTNTLVNLQSAGGAGATATAITATTASVASAVVVVVSDQQRGGGGGGGGGMVRNDGWALPTNKNTTITTSSANNDGWALPTNTNISSTSGSATWAVWAGGLGSAAVRAAGSAAVGAAVSDVGMVRNSVGNGGSGTGSGASGGIARYISPFENAWATASAKALASATSDASSRVLESSKLAQAWLNSAAAATAAPILATTATKAVVSASVSIIDEQHKALQRLLSKKALLAQIQKQVEEEEKRMVQPAGLKKMSKAERKREARDAQSQEPSRRGKTKAATKAKAAAKAVHTTETKAQFAAIVAAQMATSFQVVIPVRGRGAKGLPQKEKTFVPVTKKEEEKKGLGSEGGGGGGGDTYMQQQPNSGNSGGGSGGPFLTIPSSRHDIDVAPHRGGGGYIEDPNEYLRRQPRSHRSLSRDRGGRHREERRGGERDRSPQRREEERSRDSRREERFDERRYDERDSRRYDDERGSRRYDDERDSRRYDDERDSRHSRR